MNDFLRRGVDQRRVIPRDEDRDVPPHARAGLLLEVHLRVGDLLQVPQDAFLPLLLSHAALVGRHEGDEQIGHAHFARIVLADRLDDAADFRLARHDAIGGRRDGSRVFQPDSRRQLELQVGAAEVRVGHERLRHDHQATDRGREEEGAGTQRDPTMAHRKAQHLLVPRHHGPILVRRHLVGLECVGCDDRRDQSSNQQGEEHRRRDCQSELDEILAGDSRHEAHRQEHGNDGRGRGDDGQADLIRRIQGSLVA